MDGSLLVKNIMIKKFNIISLLILFLFPISNSISHEKIANSSCNIFINKIIDNYDQIFDHYYMGDTSSRYGFILEDDWDANLIDDFDGKKSLGKQILKRDNDDNIFIQNVYPNFVSKVNFKPGDKIIRINNIKTKYFLDEEIDEIFDNKDEPAEITYRNQEGLEFTEKLVAKDEFVISKFLGFKLSSLNSINNQTFETDALIEYEIAAEMYDGITKDDYSDMDNDVLFSIAKETFYSKNEDGDEWYGSCEYTDDELNQMQLLSPGWTVELKNLAFKSEATSSTTTSTDIYDELSGYDFESIDLISEFKGQIRVKNKFDLRNFPFDKQKISFNFAEMTETDVVLIPYESLYSNLSMLKNDKNLINGWNLVDTRVIGINYQPPRSYQDKYVNGLSIILELERESSYYVFKIILPIVLILMVCWSVIWITPKELESRLTVTIVCLLSLIAYNFVIDKELPKLEYLTVMDWIIFTSYIFATIPNFLCVISYQLFIKNKKMTLAIENKAKFVGPISYILIVLLIVAYNVNINPEHAIGALSIFSR